MPESALDIQLAAAIASCEDKKSRLNVIVPRMVRCAKLPTAARAMVSFGAALVSVSYEPNFQHCVRVG
jgi:hypothetical protein